MAEDQDPSQKTEEPTPRKLQQGREKGDVAKSREVNNLFLLVAATIAVWLIAPGMLHRLRGKLTTFIASAHALSTDPGALGRLLVDSAAEIAFLLALPLGFLMVAAVASGIVQHGLLLSAESMKPKPNKISPLTGLKRQFSLRSLAEFVKGIIKLAIVGVIGVAVIYPTFRTLPSWVSRGTGDVLHEMHRAVVLLLVSVVLVMALVAGLDFLYQHYEHRKKNRMTKQEVKDENKQSEGDPHIKAKLKQIRLERARRRMMQAVPEADVVITNPTHFAVALKYDMVAMAAPTVVAKGHDELALRIRTVAGDNDVPIVENPPLAQALYYGVELDQEIPREHYKAVAEVIGYVMQLKGRAVPA
jgi:flagellar biosynthetic protein FlhB